MIRNSAGVEEVQAGLVALILGEIGGRVPRVDRRNIRRRLILIGPMQNEIDEISVAGAVACIYFVDREAHAVARIAAPVRVAGIRRFGHPYTQESRASRT